MAPRWLLLAAAVAIPAGALGPASSASVRQHVELSVTGVVTPHSPSKAAVESAAIPEETALLSVRTKTNVQQVPTKVTHQSFLSRLKDSCTSFIIGLVLIVFSFPVMWFNESRTAKMESLILRGQEQKRTVKGDAADKGNRNHLVHIEGEHMKSCAKISDAQFDVSMDSNCVRLRRVVEVFQYVQHEKKEEREKFGGGKETVTTYTYTTEWSSTWNDSSSFEDQSKSNSKPDNLEVGTHNNECERVEYGAAFLLGKGLSEQSSAFQDASERVGSRVRHRDSGALFTLRGKGIFYYPVDGSTTRDQPKIGDARVTFTFVPDGDATVLALQVESNRDARDTFLPYRLISQPCCGGLSEEDEKQALRERAETSREDLAAEAQMGTGCFAVLCCACNLVNMCCAGVLVPEIYHLFDGSLSATKCFEEIKRRLTLLKWVFRGVGWLMMFVGFIMLFSPFLTLIKIIPFFGPIVAKIGGWIITIFSFVLTVALASIVICIAYLIYHPITALLYAAGAAAVVAVPLIIMAAIH